jgi:hypothetical protein
MKAKRIPLKTAVKKSINTVSPNYRRQLTDEQRKQSHKFFQYHFTKR